jgi:hypothetical protein
LEKNNKIAIIVVILIVIAGLIYIWPMMTVQIPIDTTTLGDTDTGTVVKNVYGNASANNSIALITGIHPRETLSIDPEIKAAKEYVRDHPDVKIIHYDVRVTKDPEDYENGRYNGEHLVQDYVNDDVASSDADCVIISHSHIESYGEGFYVATPAMDNDSVEISEKIQKTSDFNYYPRTGNETYKSTSAQLVSIPIAQSGHPTFVYEIPEDITEWDSTSKTKELFDMMVEFACN